MSEYNHLAYMESVATSLRDIQHSPTHKAFATASGMGLLQGVMEGITSLSVPFMVAIDDCSSRLHDNGADSISEVPFYQFCILKNAPVSDSAAQREAIHACKAMAKKVVARMKRSSRNKEEGLRYLDMGSFLFEGVGPVAIGYYGCAVSFSLVQPAGIVYDENDWQ